MTEVTLKLKEWGCDVEDALARFINNESMYLRFLPAVTGEEAFQTLGKAIEAGDATAAFQAAHLIKGVVANMGLTPLLNDITEIVEPARRGEVQGLDVAYARLMADLKRLADIIGE